MQEENEDSAEGSIIDIPLEKQMQLLPKSMTMKQKPGTNFHRSRSARSKKDLEGTNELDGGERQDVKIEKYTRSEMKRRGLVEGGQRSEAETMQELQKAVVEQQNMVDIMTQKYKTLEMQMIAQTEIIQYCKKGVDAEWEERKEGLRARLVEEYMRDKFAGLLQERAKEALERRKGEIDACVMDIIAGRLKGPAAESAPSVYAPPKFQQPQQQNNGG